MAKILTDEQLDILYNFDGGYLGNDSEGNPFLIIYGWDELLELQKLLEPSFEPSDKYDESVIDDYDIAWGFDDEYAICDECGVIIRTSPTSYSWTPDFFVGDGFIICGDCVRNNPGEYLQTLVNNPKVANTILDEDELESAGFERVSERYENGWYDRNDNPTEILNKALDEHPNGLFIFSISDSGQFHTGFELWVESESIANEEIEETLTEAPDEDGNLTDDELAAQEEQERKELEDRIRARRELNDKNKKDAEERRELERTKQSRIAQAQKEIANKMNALGDDEKGNLFEELFAVLVPPQGKCDTLAGELVRAWGKVIRRDWNDGDIFYHGYGLETCGNGAAFVCENTNDTIRNEITSIAEDELSGNDYSDALERVAEKLADYIWGENPETLIIENEEDMLDTDGEEYWYDYIPRYEYELTISERVQLHMEKGNIDVWDVISEVNDWLRNNGVFEGAECDTPWSSDDSYVTVKDLTPEGYEELKSWDNNPRWGIWDSYEEYLDNEYGDPEDEDEEDYNDDEDEEIEESVKTLIPPKRDEKGKFKGIRPEYDTDGEFDDYDRAQLSAYKLLKRKQPFAVIYAYSQGKGKVFLNPPLAKQSQEEINQFVNSFRRGKEQTKVTVDVLYLTKLDAIEDSLRQRNLIESNEIKEEYVEDGVYIFDGHKFEFKNVTKGTSSGFCHSTKLYADGKQLSAARCNYLNRTWERYRYQTSQRKAVNKAINDSYFDENLLKKLLELVEEGAYYKEDNSQVSESKHFTKDEAQTLCKELGQHCYEDGHYFEVSPKKCDGGWCLESTIEGDEEFDHNYFENLATKFFEEKGIKINYTKNSQLEESLDNYYCAHHIITKG